LNRGHGTSPLVVVLFGPMIQPGFGTPIRRSPATPSDGTAVETLPPPACETEKVGSATLVIQGGGNHPPRLLANPDLQDTETPPSLCQWIYERLADAGVSPQTILDPCAGRGNLTRPFRPRSRIIEYEITLKRDFFHALYLDCDLVLCNPRWSEAERWLRHVVKVVGKNTPLVFISPMLFFSGYKDAPVRKFLQLPEAPRLDHITPLPNDTFVRVYTSAAILWFNLPTVRNVAFVPSTYLIRKNEPFGPACGRGQQATDGDQTAMLAGAKPICTSGQSPPLRLTTDDEGRHGGSPIPTLAKPKQYDSKDKTPC